MIVRGASYSLIVFDDEAANDHTELMNNEHFIRELSPTEIASTDETNGTPILQGHGIPGVEVEEPPFLVLDGSLANYVDCNQRPQQHIF